MLAPSSTSIGISAGSARRPARLDSWPVDIASKWRDVVVLPPVAGLDVDVVAGLDVDVDVVVVVVTGHWFGSQSH